MSVPHWVPDSIFYQIFPDRFANGDLSNDPPNVVPWGTPPNNWHFQGGDLRGIINHFGYLLDLGINAIYLNPVFHSSSNHRYNTTDYYKIDPKLGAQKDLLALFDLAHRNGVRVVLDGVFNHCGRGFFAFADVLENQDKSPYRDWFHIHHFPVDAFSDGESKDYKAWWGIRSLPKLNTGNPAVRKYILDVARYWIEQGADGWRLDVPNEIDDDGFWAEFRQTVKTANPDAYLFGELWTPDPRWVGDTHFDGLMHYPLRDCLLRLAYAGTLEAATCAEKVQSFLELYPRENAYAMYLPLGSHDTERILTKLEGDVGKVKLALLFQFAYPGAPAIYYGDEIGMQGGKDPGCRGAFPWDESLWNHDLHDWVKHLIALRKTHAVLRRGDYRSLFIDEQNGCVAFSRTLADEKIVVVMNLSGKTGLVELHAAQIGWDADRTVRSLLSRDVYPVSEGRVNIELPPWSGAWLE
jgi:glycosidase